MTRVMIVVVAVMVALAPVSAPAQAVFAPMAKMRELKGEWTGVVTSSPLKSGGFPVKLTYEPVSGGHAVLERLKMGDQPEMVSIYHQEGDQMMMTHYCSSNTQPRLRTRTIPEDLSEFRFEFVDSTNILKANWMNITWVKLEFPGPDRIRQTWKSHDTRESPVVLDVQRKR